MLVAVGGEATDGKESVGDEIEKTKSEAIEIHDWHDLDEVRNNLDGDYQLATDLHSGTNGYEEKILENTIEEDGIEMNAGYEQTWNEGDSFDVPYPTEYISNITVEDEDGNEYASTYDSAEDTITINENTGEQYIYVICYLDDYPACWDPIETFTGTFDGNGHKIGDLSIDRPGTDYVGLFGFTSREAKITNIGLVNADVSGYREVGGLVGRNSGGTLNNSYATGTMKGHRYVGGLVGKDWHGMVSNSYATSDVSGNERVGGLLGLNHRYGMVSNSYATGDVSGGSKVGGLVGWNHGTVDYRTTLGTVSDSYATGNVSGDNRVGGLVGYNTGKVKNSYARGDVDGDNKEGGLVGSNSRKVSNSFWDIETSRIAESDGGTGKTTEEMKDIATYTDASTEGLEEAWDFVNDPYDDEGDEDIWGDIDENETINDGYPFLAWENDDEKGPPDYEYEVGPSDGDEEENVGFLSNYWWLIMLVVIIAVIVIVMAMTRSRRKPPTQQPSQQRQEPQSTQEKSYQQQSSQQQQEPPQQKQTPSQEPPSGERSDQ